jgi:hypothetical protein
MVRVEESVSIPLSESPRLKLTKAFMAITMDDFYCLDGKNSFKEYVDCTTNLS